MGGDDDDANSWDEESAAGSRMDPNSRRLQYSERKDAMGSISPVSFDGPSPIQSPIVASAKSAAIRTPHNNGFDFSSDEDEGSQPSYLRVTRPKSTSPSAQAKASEIHTQDDKPHHPPFQPHPPRHAPRGRCPKNRFAKPAKELSITHTPSAHEPPAAATSHTPHRAPTTTPHKQTPRSAQSPSSMFSKSLSSMESGSFDLDDLIHQSRAKRQANEVDVSLPQTPKQTPHPQEGRSSRHHSAAPTSPSLPTLSSPLNSSTSTTQDGWADEPSAVDSPPRGGVYDAQIDTEWGRSTAKLAIGGTGQNGRLPQLECTSCGFDVLRFRGCRWSPDVDYMHFRNFNGHSLNLDQLRRHLVRQESMAAYACQCSWQSVDKVKVLSQWGSNPGSEGGAANGELRWQRKRA